MPVRDFKSMFGDGRRAAAGHRLLPICAAFSVLWPAMALAQSPANVGAEAEPAPATQAAPGASAGSSAATLQEVVVTAEKRSSTVQKTPISITAISGAQLKEQGTTSVADLIRDIPGVSTKGGGPGQTDYTIRGLSSAAGVAPTVGFYLDDVPLGSPTVSSGGKAPIDPDLYDLARVEVLRGPQGTLYGASSMGGTIKLVPESPKMNVLKGSAQVTGSKTQGGGLNGGVNAALNIPLVEDVAAMRLVLTKKRMSGWIDRVWSSAMPVSTPDGRGNVAAAPADGIQRRANDLRLEGVRASMIVQPTAELTITPTYLYQGIKMGAQDSYDADPGRFAHYQPFNVAEPFKDSFAIGSVKAEYDFDVVTLTSISAYSKRSKVRREDETEITQIIAPPDAGWTGYTIGGGGLGPVVQSEVNDTRQFTQELRLSSNSEGPLRWIGGLFFSRMNSTYRGATDVDATAANAMFGTSDLFHQTIQDVLVQRAIFGNVSYDITKDLKITGGTRYFRSTARDVSISAGIFSEGTNHDEHATSKGSTPMVNLSYNLSPTSMVYSTVAKGYREGSAQTGVPTSTCGADLAAIGQTEAPVRFNPDTVWSYEAGSKNRFLDNTLTVNVAGYIQRWSKVQRFIALKCGFQYVDNAGSAEAKGFELEAGMRITPGLSLNFSLGHVKAVYTSDDPSTGTTRGDKLQGVADWTGSSSLRYETQLNDAYHMLSSLGVNYTGRSNITNSEPRVLPSYTLVDARIGLKAKQWGVTLFVDNLTNRRPVTGIVSALTFNPTGMDRYSTVRPRTIGLDVSHEF